MVNLEGVKAGLSVARVGLHVPANRTNLLVQSAVREPQSGQYAKSIQNPK